MDLFDSGFDDKKSLWKMPKRCSQLKANLGEKSIDFDSKNPNFQFLHNWFENVLI